MKLPKLNRIKDIRRSMDLTQQKLSRLSGVSQSLIARIEAGKVEPSYTKIKKIFDVLIKENSQNKTAKNVMNKKVIMLSKDEKIKKAAQVMKDEAISQIPVLKNNKIVGSISEQIISHNLSEKENIAQEKIEKYMGPMLPQIDEITPLSVVSSILDHTNAVLVLKNSEVKGIITRADMLKLTK